MCRQIEIDRFFARICRGAPPDANDYNGEVEFPPHQLMEPTQNNFSSEPQYRPVPQSSVPQVWI